MNYIDHKIAGLIKFGVISDDERVKVIIGAFIGEAILDGAKYNSSLIEDVIEHSQNNANLIVKYCEELQPKPGVEEDPLFGPLSWEL